MEPSTGFDTGLALVLALGLGVLMAGAAYFWRHLLPQADALPLWKFLRRSGVTRTVVEDSQGTARVVDAEQRCALCANAVDCDKRLAAGQMPPEHCPNQQFLARNS
jgi:LPXTG-motif cell wall-anchored protein